MTKSAVKLAERELQLARALSDTEKSVRDSSLLSLRDYLSTNAASLSDAELDRLWKALFYCVWMADKRPVITETIRAVVGLDDVLGWKFLAALLRCMVREWCGIDKHRVDKFYELVNAGIAVCVRKVCEVGTDVLFLEEVEVLLGILERDVWQRAGKGGLGVALHLLDVYVDKVARPLLLRGGKLSGNHKHKVFDSLLDPLYKRTGSAEGHLLSLGKRIEQRVLARLVELVSSDELQLKVKDQRDMISRASKRVFAVASCKSTADDVRKNLYELRVQMKAFVAVCEESQKNEQNKGKSGVVVSEDTKGRHLVQLE